MAGAYYSLKRSPPVVSKVPLVHPVTVCGEEVAELWLSRPKLGMLRGLDIGKLLGGLQHAAGSEGDDLDLTALPDDILDTVRGLLPALASMKPEEADAVDYTDFWSLLPVILGFFSDVPTTGSVSP